MKKYGRKIVITKEMLTQDDVDVFLSRGRKKRSWLARFTNWLQSKVKWLQLFFCSERHNHGKD